MQTVTDLLIDISDNMKDKLSIAQKALSDEIIPYLNFAQPVGMRTFLSIAKSPIVINSIDLGINSQQDLLEKIKKLPIPNGGAPIAYTMQKSLQSLNDYKDADIRRVILVTAGIDTDGGTYQYEVEKENKEKHIQVHILGIGIDGQDAKVAERVAVISGGTFCNIPEDKNIDVRKIKEVLSPLINVLKGIETTQNKEPETVQDKIKLSSFKESSFEKEIQAKETFLEKIVKGEESENIEEQKNSKQIFSSENKLQQLKSNNKAIVEFLEKNESVFQKLIAAKDESDKEIERLKQIEKDVVIVEDEEQKYSISRKSELMLFEHLQKKYPERVKWLNKESIKNQGYDFEVVQYDNDSVEYYIACKGAADDSKTFYLTKQEWEVCLQHNRNYQVYLVRNLESKPTFVIIDNLMGWILNGKVRPYALKNEKVKAEKIMLTLL